MAKQKKSIGPTNINKVNSMCLKFSENLTITKIIQINF